MDLSELLSEMDEMSSDLTVKVPVKPAGTSSRTEPPAFSSYRVVSSQPKYLNGTTVGRGKAATKPQKRKVLQKHKTHGSCPVELMTDFLVLVSSGKMSEALTLCTEILKHEPDNPLIKMYQETMSEYVQRGLEENDEEEDADMDEDDEAGEGKDDESAGSGSGEEGNSEDEDEDEDEDEHTDSEVDRKSNSSSAERKGEDKEHGELESPRNRK